MLIKLKMFTVLQGPVSINILAGAGTLLAASSNVESNGALQNVALSSRLMPQQRGILKTLM